MFHFLAHTSAFIAASLCLDSGSSKNVTLEAAGSSLRASLDALSLWHTLTLTLSYSSVLVLASSHSQCLMHDCKIL